MARNKTTAAKAKAKKAAASPSKKPVSKPLAASQAKKPAAKAAPVASKARRADATAKPQAKAKVAAKPAAARKPESKKTVSAAAAPVAKPVQSKTMHRFGPAAVAQTAVAQNAAAQNAGSPTTAARPAAAAAPVQAGKPAAHNRPAVHQGVARPPVQTGARPAYPQPQRAVAASMSKPAGQRISAPLAPATPREIAEKTAQQRQLAQAQKKPVSQRHGFKTNEFIVYPAHGVGRIVGIEEQEIAGMSLELFVITFDKEKLTLRVPTGKLESVGMRKLADEGIVKKAMETLKGRARIKRTMWSRRAQEYVAKINSGDLVSIAEVVRDLFRSEAQPEQSYSERQLYEDALDRMAREIAAVDRLDERGAVQRITEVLSKSAKGRRAAEGEAEAADEAESKAA